MMRRAELISSELILLCIFLTFRLAAEEPPNDPQGYWKIVDNRRGFVQTVIAVYIRDEILYGRNIVNYKESDGTLVGTIYEPKILVTGDAYNRYLTEVDFLWGFRFSEGRWIDGRILDPRWGIPFACSLWREGETLVVRGRVGPFGKKVILYRVDEEDLPPGFILPSTDEWSTAPPKLR